MEREAYLDRLSDPAYARYWNTHLRDIDERLKLVFVSEGAPPQADMVPGRWHVMRDNSDRGAPDTFWAITTKNGSYREMGSDVLDWLRSIDTWNPRVSDQILADLKRKRDEKERDRLRQQEDRIDEIALGVKALTSPSVLVNTDIPFSAKAGKRKK
jgi:hypothetical protein